MGMLGFGLGVCKRKQAPVNKKTSDSKNEIVSKTDKQKENVKSKVVKEVKPKVVEQVSKVEEPSKPKEVFTRKTKKKKVSEEKETKVDKSYWNF